MIEKLNKKNFLTRRTIIFIDHANIFYNIQNLNIRIDYNRFKNVLKREDHLVGAFVYMGIPEKVYPKKRRFLQYLDEQGFVIQARPIKTLPEGKKVQKRLDIFIYRDIVELADEGAYDKAILVSGDSDFIEIVKKLKELKKQIEIWSFKQSISRKLIHEIGEDHVHYINEILSEITC